MKLLIACKVLEREIKTLLDEMPYYRAIFLSFSFHRKPDLLNKRLQELLERMLFHFDDIKVLYGRCAGRLQMLSGVETFQVNDCFDLILGSKRRFKLFLQQPGSYFLSDGWVREDGTPFEKLQKVMKKGLDIKDLSSIIYNGYRRLIYIRTGIEDKDSVERARFSASKLGWEYVEIGSDLRELKHIISTEASFFEEI